MSTETAPAATPPEEPADAPVAATGETSGPPVTAGDPAPAPSPLTAALLNLSGFGLGYLHLRAWVRLAVALAATAGLVWVALPIEREPLAVWWAVGYLGALGLFALDGALLARRRTGRQARRATVWAPATARRVAWATLATVPLLGATYLVTQHEVLEHHLARDLDRAEESLEPTGHIFTPHREVYDAAYATYARTAAEHPRTRAADRVPGLVDDLYARARGNSACNALPAVRHFAQPETADPLRAVAQEDLPGTLRDCGIQHLERGNLVHARPVFADLLTDHPASEPAAALPQYLATWRDGLIKDLGSKDGCAETTLVTASTGFLARFDSGKVSTLADKARAQVPAGLLKCGVQQFENRRYTAAFDILVGLLESYPRAKEAEYADRLRIATGIALLDPNAGVVLPARTEPAGTITLTVFNHSPRPFEMVYTGPATGVVTIDACDDCTYYAEGDEPECTGYSLTVPSTRVTLPVGDYRTATQYEGVVHGWSDEAIQEVSFTEDGSYCTWQHKR